MSERVRSVSFSRARSFVGLDRLRADFQPGCDFLVAHALGGVA